MPEMDRDRSPEAPEPDSPSGDGAAPVEPADEPTTGPEEPQPEEPRPDDDETDVDQPDDPAGADAEPDETEPDADEPDETDPDETEPEADRPVATMVSRPRSRVRFTPSAPSAWSRLRRAFTTTPDGGQIAVAALVFLLGFAGAVQISDDEDDVLQGARRDDLLQALDGLTLQGERLQEQVEQLEADRRDLVSGAGNEEAALTQAQERFRQLNILAGVAPASGPGIDVTILDPESNVIAVTLLSGLHDLRSAGAEAVQITGANGQAVRVVANSYFLDVDGNVTIDGVTLEPPYSMTVIGDPSSLAGAVNFPLGLADDVRADRVGGDVVVEERDQVTVEAVRAPSEPRYASPSPEGQ